MMEAPGTSFGLGVKKVEDVESVDCSALMELVFYNELLGDKITSNFVHLEDFKFASESCRALHHAVRVSDKFSKMGMLCLSKKNLAQWDEEQSANKDDGETGVVVTSFWKRLELDLSATKQISKILEQQDILQDVETLRLSQTDPEEDEEDGNNKRKQLIELGLTSTSILCELQVEFGIFMEQDFRNLSTPAVMQLNSLEVFCEQPKNINTAKIEGSYVMTNFQHLSTLPLQLKSIKVDIPFQDLDEVHIPLFNLIKSNCTTISTLHLRLDKIWSFEDLILPNLKQLGIHIFSTSEEGLPPMEAELLSFLTNQGPLESLDISIPHFPTNLLKTMAIKGIQLKKFWLQALSFKGQMDWNFLASFPKLTDFSIRRQKQDELTANKGIEQAKFGVTADTILDSLPASLARLKFRGFLPFWPPWPQLPMGQRMDLVSKFANLTCLAIRGCRRNAVCDDVFQAILRGMGKLKKLEITYGNELTDRAITGVDVTGVHEDGVSLQQLKGLSHFSLKYCPKISAAALLSSVHHEYMHSLTFVHCNSLTPEEIETILAQNPALRYLSAQLQDPMDLINVKGKLSTHRRIHLDLTEVSMFGDRGSDASFEVPHDDYDYYHDSGDDDYVTSGDSDDGCIDRYGNHFIPDFTACDRECGYCGNCDY